MSDCTIATVIQAVAYGLALLMVTTTVCFVIIWYVRRTVSTPPKPKLTTAQYRITQEREIQRNAPKKIDDAFVSIERGTRK